MPETLYNGVPYGFDYPHGRPDELRAAQHTWEAVADKLDGKAKSLNDAAGSALSLDWSGKASLAYASSSMRLSNHFAMGAMTCREAAVACKRLAHDLEHAQHKADTAMVDIMDAIDAEKKARAELTDANDRAADAMREQVRLDATVAAAKAGGPHAEVAAKAAVKPQRAAAEGRANAASAEAARAQGRVDRAHSDLLDARARGKAAKAFADSAAHKATGTLQMVASYATVPPHVGVPAVPVSVRPHRPGDPPGLSPSDIRKVQIHKEKENDGKRWPWMLSDYEKQLKDAALGLGVAGNLDKVAPIAARVLNSQKTRDEMLRNGIGPLNKALKALGGETAAKLAKRGLGPAGFIVGFATAGAEGRKPLDAAGKSAAETIGGLVATFGAALLCATTPLDGPVGGAGCVVLVGGAAVGGGITGGKIYDELSPIKEK